MLGIYLPSMFPDIWNVEALGNHNTTIIYGMNADVGWNVARFTTRNLNMTKFNYSGSVVTLNLLCNDKVLQSTSLGLNNKYSHIEL
jgi:hypothetical protein